jgi:DegV family protein with EDD domain
MNLVNVFPAKDKDTGTNLDESWEAVEANVLALPDDATMYQFFEAVRAAGRKARGNSGNITYAFLRGFSNVVSPNRDELVRDFSNQQNISEELARATLQEAGYFDDNDTIELDTFYAAVQAGSDAAFASVDVPLIGSVLTVMEATASLPKYDSIEATIEAMVISAWVAVENTGRKDPFMSNGVVDGCAAGYALVWEATYKELIGDDSDESNWQGFEDLRPVATAVDTHEYDSAYQYCCPVWVSSTEKSNLEKLKKILRTFGDSMEVNPVAGVGEYRIHIHVDDTDRLAKEVKRHGFVIEEFGPISDMYAQEAEGQRELRERNVYEDGTVMIVTDNAAGLSEDEGNFDVLDITVRPDGTTAAVSAEEWYETGAYWMNPENNGGIDVIFIILSSKLSSTFNNAQKASARLALDYPNARIACIDSLCGSRGQAYLALTARRMIDDGYEFDEIVKWVEETRHYIHIFIVCGDTRALVDMGRLPEPADEAMKRLGLLPLIYLAPDGALKLYGFVRAKNIVSSLVKRAKAVCRPLDKSAAVATLHTKSSLPLAQELGAALIPTIGLIEPYEIDHVVGAYLPDNENTVAVVVVGGKPRR